MTTNVPPQIFEPEYYQHLYDIEQAHWWAIGMRDVMIELFKKDVAQRQHLKVLDSGCGTGYLLGFLKRYSLDGEVVGLDYSTHALRFCQQRGAGKLTLASSVTSPFADQSFDLIICIDTLQHLSPVGADVIAIEEFARLLRPGGLAYVRTNSVLGHVPLEGTDPNQYRRYRRDLLSKTFEGAGLVVERATYVNCLPSVWAALVEYATSRRNQTAAIGPGLAIRPQQGPFVSSLLRSELRLEAWLIGKGVDLPFGHSLAILARKP
ncbi:MAG: methyltransferase domain-containing protein [Anaerolineae bacterium]|nr:methyltransferase domain-containing protein [Anaerolineae bacterium]